MKANHHKKRNIKCYHKYTIFSKQRFDWKIYLNITTKKIKYRVFYKKKRSFNYEGGGGFTIRKFHFSPQKYVWMLLSENIVYCSFLKDLIMKKWVVPFFIKCLKKDYIVPFSQTLYSVCYLVFPENSSLSYLYQYSEIDILIKCLIFKH